MSETPIRAAIQVYGSFDAERFAERLGVERWQTFDQAWNGKGEEMVWSTEVELETCELSFVVRPLLHRINVQSWHAALASIRSGRQVMAIEIEGLDVAAGESLPRLRLDADLVEKIADLDLHLEFVVRVTEGIV